MGHKSLAKSITSLSSSSAWLHHHRVHWNPQSPDLLICQLFCKQVVWQSHPKRSILCVCLGQNLEFSLTISSLVVDPFCPFIQSRKNESLHLMFSRTLQITFWNTLGTKRKIKSDINLSPDLMTIFNWRPLKSQWFRASFLWVHTAFFQESIKCYGWQHVTCNQASVT